MSMVVFIVDGRTRRLLRLPDETSSSSRFFDDDNNDDDDDDDDDDSGNVLLPLMTLVKSSNAATAARVRASLNLESMPLVFRKFVVRMVAVPFHRRTS